MFKQQINANGLVIRSAFNVDCVSYIVIVFIHSDFIISLTTNTSFHIGEFTS